MWSLAIIVSPDKGAAGTESAPYSLNYNKIWGYDITNLRDTCMPSFSQEISREDCNDCIVESRFCAVNASVFRNIPDFEPQVTMKTEKNPLALW